MIEHDEIAALILAAGYSSRMGKLKPLLPLGPITVIERCMRLFLDTGIDDVRVVVGHRFRDLVPLIEKLGVRWIVNEHYQHGMLSSIKVGIHALENPTKAFFLLPVDIPLVRHDTVIELLSAYGRHDADVLYPAFRGKRGHPPLINAALRSGILSWNEEGGLRSFLLQHQSRAVNIEVADENVLLDMDNLEQYEEICRKLSL